MRLLLLPNEVAGMLGARLMYTGVPFTRIQKPKLKPDQLKMLDDVWNRILDQRDTGQVLQKRTEPAEMSATQLECELTHEEVALYLFVLKSCWEECKGDPVDLELHLGNPNEEGLRQLVNKLDALSSREKNKLS
jgi:hypothetical protein